ncbi:MAG: hypothetical protein LUH82_07835, partial [Clostridiales bacterium]|nr:hypothetical protein [Clostridiales bacterium]
YQYLGYKKREIVYSFLFGNLIEISKIILISAIPAFLLMIILNFINDKIELINFQIFTFNYSLIIIYLTLLLLFSTIYSLTNIRKVTNNNWYNLLGLQRDLL